MSPNPPAVGPPRPAAVVNEAIRAIVRGAVGREWTRAERALYALLLDEWDAARAREEMTTAA